MEEDYATKQEGNVLDGKNLRSAPPSSSNTWSRLKDPRVVRVSRAFGGKDRHSKVCTVRGLRDRRVRLSVPTAIQLYDLQDRLGVNQPSKVVDWLLNAAKHEINELPPLQMPPGSLNFGHSFQELMLANHGVGSSSSQSNREGSNWGDPLGIPRSNFSKEIEEEEEEEEDANPRNEKEDHCGLEGEHHNFFPRPSHPSIPGLLNNVIPNYNAFFCRDTSNFTLSRIHGYTHQSDENHQNSNVVQFSPSLSLPPGSYFPFPPHIASPLEVDPKQYNHFHLLNSSSQNPLSNSSSTPNPYSMAQSLRPLHLSMAPRSDNNEFPPK